jgi:glycine cleavage system regulatory protein
MDSIVVTLVGPDRPGLVEIVSDVVRRAEGNWLESRMAHLAGQFAGIVLIEVDSQHSSQLIEELGKLNQHGLKIVVEQDVTERQPRSGQKIAFLNVVGNDRPGIVREVSQVLASHRVNVEEFDTDCSEAPHTGGRIFRAEARLCLPENTGTENLQQALEQIATDLMVDIVLKSEDS